MRRVLLATAAVASFAGWSAQADDAAPSTVEELLVTGRAQRLYRTDQTTVGKQAEDPLNIPQAVQVINAELIDDLGARDVTDLYRNISGVSFFSYAGVTFRGFRQEQAFYDGLRGNPFIGFSVPQLFNIERVEVLKGPAGMLFGPGSPGGTINYVTKTPGEVFAGEVAVVAGNYDRLGVSGEIQGPLPLSSRLTGRAGLFFEEKDSFRRNASSTSLIGDVGLNLAVTDDLDVTAQYTRYDQDLPGNRLRGVQVNLAGDFLSPISWNHNEATDFLTLRSDVWQTRAVWAPSLDLRADFAVRYFESSEAQEYHEQRDLLDTDRNGVADTITREFRDQRRVFDGLSFGGNLAGQFQAVVTHKILVGGDWYEENSEQLSRTYLDPTRSHPGGVRGPVPNLALNNPVYGLGSGAAYRLAVNLPYTRSANVSRRWGAYVQDQVMLGERFLLTGGVRYDRFDDENKINGVAFEDSDLTWRAGAIFKPRPDISVYGSWSNTFEPQGAASQDAAVGGPFEPVTGSQIEGGVKTALMGGRIQANAAVYRIIRENVLQTDTTKPPVGGRNQLAPIGEVTSEGFEVDVSADVTPDWVFTANYGRNDTRVTGTVPGQAITNAVGDRFVNAPKQKVGVWTRYQVAPIRTAFALGAEYVSERVGFDRERVKPYTTWDASIITTFDFGQVMVRIDNIFDKTYAASGFGLRNGAFPGEPRTVFVELKREF